MSRVTIFIHTPSRRAISAQVCAYSLRAGGRQPDSFDIQFISLEETPELLQHDSGFFCWKEGTRPLRWQADLPQAFVFLRRKIPDLMNFEGRALLLDPDILALGDVSELLTRDMRGKALVCRPRTDGQGYYSSVTLMDCGKLRHWNWETELEEVFRRERPARPWLGFANEDPETVGALEREWNDFDHVDERTRLLHYTDRRIQPWLTGLPYRGDFVAGDSLAYRAKRLLGITGVHRPHPHEDLFLKALNQAIASGEISEADVQEQQHRGLFRPSVPMPRKQTQR